MTKIGHAVQTHLFSGRHGHQREPTVGDMFARDQVNIHFDRAENLYASWRSPTCIISDGPYGVSGYPVDSHKAETLADWYEPHIKSWSKYSSPETTLWFWNTESGLGNSTPCAASKWLGVLLL